MYKYYMTYDTKNKLHHTHLHEPHDLLRTTHVTFHSTLASCRLVPLNQKITSHTSERPHCNKHYRHTEEAKTPITTFLYNTFADSLLSPRTAHPVLDGSVRDPWHSRHLRLMLLLLLLLTSPAGAERPVAFSCSPGWSILRDYIAA